MRPIDLDAELARALDRGERAGRREARRVVYSAAQKKEFARGRMRIAIWLSAAEWAALSRAFRRSGEPTMRQFLLARLGLRGL